MAQSLERTLRAEGKSEKTIYSYRLCVRAQRVPGRRGHDLTVDVSKDDIRLFITEQATPRDITDSKGRVHRGGSPATALVRFKSLQQFFKHCVQEDELEVSPMAGMTAPNVEESLVPVVPDDALTRLLKARSGKTLGDLRDTASCASSLIPDADCPRSPICVRATWTTDSRRSECWGRASGPAFAPFGAKTASAIDDTFDC